MRATFLDRGDRWKAVAIATAIEILLLAQWASTGGLKGGPNSLAWLQMPGIIAQILLESVWRRAPDLIETLVFFGVQIGLLWTAVLVVFMFWRAYQDAKHALTNTN